MTTQTENTEQKHFQTRKANPDILFAALLACSGSFFLLLYGIFRIYVLHDVTSITIPVEVMASILLVILIPLIIYSFQERRVRKEAS